MVVVLVRQGEQRCEGVENHHINVDQIGRQSVERAVFRLWGNVFTSAGARLPEAPAAGRRVVKHEVQLDQSALGRRQGQHVAGSGDEQSQLVTIFFGADDHDAQPVGLFFHAEQANLCQPCGQRDRRMDRECCFGAATLAGDYRDLAAEQHSGDQPVYRVQTGRVESHLREEGGCAAG